MPVIYDMLLVLLYLFIGVNGNITCWPEVLSTGEQTSQFCAKSNSTLLYMTDGLQEALMYMFITSAPTGNKDEVLAWTKHRVNKHLYDEGKIYYSEFPFSDDVQSLEESTLCIYAIFYLNNETVGWVPSDCNDNNLNTVNCCYFGKICPECWNATLYTEAVTWYTAENYCAKEGGSLVNLTHSTNVYTSFKKTPWISSGLTKFWTGHYATGNIVENFEISQMNYFDEVVNNQTGCVYLIVKRQYQNFPKFQLATDSCNEATYGFICLKPIHEFYFDRTEQIVYTSNVLKYDGQPYTITECQNECLEMIKNGFACNGFDYNIANSSCRFRELIFIGQNVKYDRQYSSDWDSVDRTFVHALAGNYKPKEEAVQSTKNEGKTTLSYSYNNNDQTTLYAEDAKNSDSNNTGDHLAARNGDNTDTTVTGKTFAVGACIVVAMAGVAVLGSTFIRIIKITQNGRSSCAINNSDNDEDYCFSNFKPVVCGIINQNNFINKPPESFQLRRITVSEGNCSNVPNYIQYHREYTEIPSYSSFDF